MCQFEVDRIVSLPTISTILKQRTLEEDGRAMRVLQKNDTILEETNCRGRG